MEAAEICKGCTFRECIEIARNLPIGQRAEREGTWDGALYINGRRREDKPIEHGTTSGAAAHRRQGERPCDPCRHAETAKRLADKRAREERSA